MDMFKCESRGKIGFNVWISDDDYSGVRGTKPTSPITVHYGAGGTAEMTREKFKSCYRVM